MRKPFALAFVVAAELSTTAASAYSSKDARYVTTSGNKAVLAYVVCLEKRMRNIGQLGIKAALDRAERACAKQKAKLPRSASEPNAEEIRLQIMECGFKQGDSDAC